MSFPVEIQKAFGKYYGNSHYPKTVVSELMEIFVNDYESTFSLFEEHFVKPTQTLLHTLRNQGVPLFTRYEQSIRVIIHLAVSQPMGTGEFIFRVSRSKPGTLTLQFSKYVTHHLGSTLEKPIYDTGNLTITPDCVTLDYLKACRIHYAKNYERTNVMFRLCWVMVVNEGTEDSVLKVFNPNDVLKQNIEIDAVESIATSRINLQSKKEKTLNKPYKDDPYAVENRTVGPKNLFDLLKEEKRLNKPSQDDPYVLEGRRAVGPRKAYGIRTQVEDVWLPREENWLNNPFDDGPYAGERRAVGPTNAYGKRTQVEGVRLLRETNLLNNPFNDDPYAGERWAVGPTDTSTAKTKPKF